MPDQAVDEKVGGRVEDHEEVRDWEESHGPGRRHPPGGPWAAEDAV